MIVLTDLIYPHKYQLDRVPAQITKNFNDKQAFETLAFSRADQFSSNVWLFEFQNVWLSKHHHYLKIIKRFNFSDHQVEL